MENTLCRRSLVTGAASLLLSVALRLPSVEAQAPPDRPDLLIADFEGKDYGDWTVTGSAFGTAPAQGALPGQMPVSGYQGHGLANSFLGGDDATGTLTSPPFTIDRKFLNFLIGGGGFPGRTCINLLIDNETVRTATGPNTQPGGSERLEWASWEVSALQGKTARVQIVDNATGGWGHINVDDITQSDTKAAEDIRTAPLYEESYRPQFHFSPKADWMNDPNGLVYKDGEYHLFFQACPGRLGSNGVMYWGHAISADLVHWKERGFAIEPDSLGTIFSGSAVVDEDNTAGFAPQGEKPIVAMYTAAGGLTPESKGQPFTQCITYSLDNGRTWTKFSGNPVIQHIVHENRDPRLVWYAPTRHWILALYLDGDTYALFSSPNLKQWTRLQTVPMPGSSECPDFFPIFLDGDPKEERWIFTGANGHYLVGAFDGTTYHIEGAPLPEDYGGNYYAVQSWAHIPATDGRRIQISWMAGGSYPHMPFNQQMSFPCEITLRSTPDGPRIHRWPVREIAGLYERSHHWKNETLAPGSEFALNGLSGGLYDVEAEFDLRDATAVGLKVRGEDVRYTVDGHTIAAVGRHTTLAPRDDRISLRLLVDRTSLELFGNGGEVSMTSCCLPRQHDEAISVYSKGGSAKLVSLTVHPLKSAWK